MDGPSPNQPDVAPEAIASETKSVWHQRYAQKHRLRRIVDFPEGIAPPRRVRIYRRHEHFMLQWWDKRAKRTLSERVDDDLLAALSRAREIDRRLDHWQTSGNAPRRCRPDELVASYCEHLNRRADAGEIDPRTADRYGSATQYFLKFAGQPDVARRYPHIGRMDAEFQLEFSAYLNTLQIAPNGHGNAARRPLRSQAFVLDVLRAMFMWAADPQQGNLLPEGFLNPFARRKRRTTATMPDPVGEPDITMPMALELVMACDAFQLPIFAPLLLFGLRPGELGWIFREHTAGDWLRVVCIHELAYATKGRRDKRFPHIACLDRLWQTSPGQEDRDLLYVNRRVAEGKVQPFLLRESLTGLTAEFRRRCAAAHAAGAAQQRDIRDRLMKDAGQLNYDHVEGEFGKLARHLEWPRSATLKDLRHLFSTSLENAGVPLFYRKYFMGQSFGTAPIVAYTHLSEAQVKHQFDKALTTELAPIVEAIETRSAQLVNLSTDAPPF